jgi:hypothetical protein
LVPLWFQVAIVLGFLFLGFASEHYKKSRDVDPFHAHSMQVMSHIQASKSKHGSSVLTQEEDEHLEYDNGQRYHVIFSTDCSPYQHWQRYGLLTRAMEEPSMLSIVVSMIFLSIFPTF